MAAPTRTPGNEGNLGKSLLLLALACLAGLIIYKTFSGDGFSFSNILQDPKEVRVTYVPSDFKPNIDEEDAIAILSNPERYQHEFDDLVYNLNLGLLYHIANRMNLPDSARRQMEPEYKKHHEYLKKMYYDEFVALKDPSSTEHETWYSANSGNAVQLFNEVAGKYTCFLVTTVLTSVIKTDNGKLMAKGKGIDTPCGIAISEGLRPMVERMQKHASILDFSASRNMMKDKVSRGIFELATFEIKSKKGVSDQLKYQILGYSVSTTEIEIEALSIIKAGFKMDNYFDITLNPSKGIVFVTLPEPTIVSHEVFPRVNKLDVGWFSGVKGGNIDENINALRREFRSEAINEDRILDKAKMRADSVMQLMLQPVVKSLNKKYVVQTRFKAGGIQEDTADDRMRKGEQTQRPVNDASAAPQKLNPKFIPQ